MELLMVYVSETQAAQEVTANATEQDHAHRSQDAHLTVQERNAVMMAAEEAAEHVQEPKHAMQANNAKNLA